MGYIRYIGKNLKTTTTSDSTDDDKELISRTAQLVDPAVLHANLPTAVGTFTSAASEDK